MLDFKIYKLSSLEIDCFLSFYSDIFCLCYEGYDWDKIGLVTCPVVSAIFGITLPGSGFAGG